MRKFLIVLAVLFAGVADERDALAARVADLEATHETDLRCLDGMDALAAENARLRASWESLRDTGARLLDRAEKAEAQIQAVEALCNDPRARYIDGMRWVGVVNVRNALATTEAGEES